MLALVAHHRGADLVAGHRPFLFFLAIGTTTVNYFAFFRLRSIAWSLAICLALLVGIIAFGMLKESPVERTWRWRLTGSVWNESQRITQDQNQPAKMGSVFGRVREHIVILSPTPEIDKSSEYLRLYNVCRSEGKCLWGDAAVAFTVRWNQASTYEIVLWYEHMALWQRRITDFAFHMGSEILSRRTASISPAGAKAEIIFARSLVALPNPIEEIRTDESAFVSDQRFLGQPSLPIRHFGQHDSKDGNHEGGECGNRRVFLNDKTSNAIPIDSERDRDAGNICVIGGAICLLLAAYALLKRF